MAIVLPADAARACHGWVSGQTTRPTHERGTAAGHSAAGSWKAWSPISVPHPGHPAAGGVPTAACASSDCVGSEGAGRALHAMLPPPRPWRAGERHFANHQGQRSASSRSYGPRAARTGPAEASLLAQLLLPLHTAVPTRRRCAEPGLPCSGCLGRLRGNELPGRGAVALALALALAAAGRLPPRPWEAAAVVCGPFLGCVPSPRQDTGRVRVSRPPDRRYDRDSWLQSWSPGGGLLGGPLPHPCPPVRTHAAIFVSSGPTTRFQPSLVQGRWRKAN
jgi:hypothetical protein